MPRKPLADKVIQTSIRLPSSLHERLREQADALNRPIGEIIRVHLEHAFSDQPQDRIVADEKTRELIDAVASAAMWLRLNYGLWHSDRFSFEAFKTAVEKIMMLRYRPDGEPIPKPNPNGIARYIYDDDVKVDEIARAIAQTVVGELIKTEEKP